MLGSNPVPLLRKMRFPAGFAGSAKLDGPFSTTSFFEQGGVPIFFFRLFGGIPLFAVARSVMNKRDLNLRALLTSPGAPLFWPKNHDFGENAQKSTKFSKCPIRSGMAHSAFRRALTNFPETCAGSGYAYPRLRIILWFSRLTPKEKLWLRLGFGLSPLNPPFQNFAHFPKRFPIVIFQAIAQNGRS